MGGCQVDLVVLGVKAASVPVSQLSVVAVLRKRLVTLVLIAPPAPRDAARRSTGQLDSNAALMDGIRLL